MTLTFGQLHANDDNEVLVYYNGSQIHLYNVDGINYIIPSEVESSFYDKFIVMQSCHTHADAKLLIACYFFELLSIITSHNIIL